MKLATKGILVAAGAFAMASGASAQDVETKKTAPLQQLLPNSYGKIQLRHELDVKMDDNKVTNQIPNVSVRPTLGSKFFDDKLNAYATWIFQMNAGSSVVKRVGVEAYASYDLYSAGIFSITPGVYTTQKNGDSFAAAYPELSFGVSDTFDTTAGGITVSGSIMPYAKFNSGKNSADSLVDVENRTGREEFSLNEDGDTQIEQREAIITNQSAFGVTYKPTAAKGLSLTLHTLQETTWTPQYVAKDVDGETRTSRDGYEVSGITLNRLIVGYKVSDTVSLSNQVRQYIDGAYEAGVDTDHPILGKRWENRLALTATLF